MQEEVDEKTVALAINGGKISGRILKVPVFSHAVSGSAARLLYRFDCWTASLVLLLLSLFTLLLILLCAAFYARS